MDIHLLAKIGYQWMLKGTQQEVATPGQNEKCYLAGALNFATGEILHCIWYRKVNGLFIDLLAKIEAACPLNKYTKIYVVVDNYGIHKAQAVVKWLANHPRSELLYQPTYCPKANPIERAFGDVHDKCTRNHQRTRLTELIADVKQHLKVNGPWRYQLSSIYYHPKVTRKMRNLSFLSKVA